MKLKDILIILISITGCFIVFYLSWLPTPDIGLQPYFPAWLGKWTNSHGNLRTSVPFLFLGSFLEATNSSSRYNWKTTRLIMIILTVVVLIAEIGQLNLPKRHFDWSDIGYGIVGSFFGVCLGKIFKRRYLH